MIIINSLQWLVQSELIKIYGYVIMPNHIHLMREQLKMNGKEFPKNNFKKFTAKTLVNSMKATNDAALKNYAVTIINRQYNIWLRYPLAIRIINTAMGVQKLDYTHLNTMQPHWLLCNNPADYRLSSARFYGQNGMLSHFGEVF
jgi:putative transposase